MLITLLSPAKNLDVETPAPRVRSTQPRMLKRSEELVAVLQQLETPGLGKLMKLSEKLAQLNVERYQAWQNPQPADHSYAALYCFAGAVFQALDARSLENDARKRLHSGLRILSGLYGLLRPCDAIQPYRLEMGTRA